METWATTGPSRTTTSAETRWASTEVVLRNKPERSGRPARMSERMVTPRVQGRASLMREPCHLLTPCAITRYALTISPAPSRPGDTLPPDHLLDPHIGRSHRDLIDPLGLERQG